jgi:hypothetical protein
MFYYSAQKEYNEGECVLKIYGKNYLFGNIFDLERP